EGGGTASTVVSSELESFELSVSVVVVVTEASFVIVPGADVVTITSIVAEPPAATAPREHVTTPAAWRQEPCEGVAETSAVPAGSVSVTTTAWASEGPAFATVREYVTS